MEQSSCKSKLEARDPKIYAVWKKTRAWSIKGMNGYLKELGAKYRREFFESQVKDEGKTFMLKRIKFISASDLFNLEYCNPP